MATFARALRASPAADRRWIPDRRPRLADAVLERFRRADARQTIRCLTPDLRAGDHVLDLGCGTGFVGALATSELGCSVVGCDVLPMNVALDQFYLFDGERVPFVARTFDVTLLAYVLHHVSDPLGLLREAARVTRRCVVVVEDTPRNAADRLWGRLHVHGFNGTYGLPRGHVRSEAAWLPIFAAAGLRLVRRQTMGRFERFPPNARTQYTLAPEAP